MSKRKTRVLGSYYVLYCLIKNGRPIYVGVTTKRRIIKRIKEHEALKKDFDSHIIIKHYKTKKEALIAENSIIKLNSIFDIGLVNGKIFLDEYTGSLIKDKYDGGMD